MIIGRVSISSNAVFLTVLATGRQNSVIKMAFMTLYRRDTGMSVRYFCPKACWQLSRVQSFRLTSEVASDSEKPTSSCGPSHASTTATKSGRFRWTAAADVALMKEVCSTEVAYTKAVEFQRHIGSHGAGDEPAFWSGWSGGIGESCQNQGLHAKGRLLKRIVQR